MPMVSGQDRHDLTATLQMFAECISSLERRVEALEKQNDLLEQLVSRHSDLAPRCPHCGQSSVRVNGQWCGFHASDCPRVLALTKRITHP